MPADFVPVPDEVLRKCVQHGGPSLAEPLYVEDLARELLALREWVREALESERCISHGEDGEMDVPSLDSELRDKGRALLP